MNRDPYTLALWAMWLALPTTAINYWRAWDQLPARMAVHFDAQWRPNGWTSREGSLGLALGTMGFLLVLFTVAAYAVRAKKPESAWVMLGVFYLALGGFWMVSNWMVGRALGG